jgi:phosphoribosylglycinamide formyltransferase-1
LLPKFGGKGMHGMHVHEAVAAAGEKETGITIHYVNEHYDEGDIIAQFSTPLPSGASSDEIAHLIAGLEAKHFPAVVEEVVTNV